MDLRSTRLRGDSGIAITSFVAARHPTESCGTNGLPLTPNSVAILGQSQRLRLLAHKEWDFVFRTWIFHLMNLCLDDELYMLQCRWNKEATFQFVGHAIYQNRVTIKVYRLLNNIESCFRTSARTWIA